MPSHSPSSANPVEAINKRAGRDILAATGVAVLLLAVAGAALLWAPWVFVLIVVVGIGGAQLEMGHVLARHRGVAIQYLPLLVGTALVILGAYVAHWLAPLSPGWWVVGSTGLVAVLILCLRLRGPLDGYVRDVSSSLLLLVYPGLLATSLIFIVAGDQGPARIATFIVGVAATDTGGYLLGVLIGRHPFAPRISPKKSWEGVVGSVVLAGVAVTLMVALLLHQDWWKGLILALVLVVVSILGDLVESVIKRDIGIKDMGTVLPGHGGLMDRLDGYLLAALPAWLTMCGLFGV